MVKPLPLAMLFLLMCRIAAGAGEHADPPAYRTVDLAPLVEGQPFFIHGLCYNPTRGCLTAGLTIGQEKSSVGEHSAADGLSFMLLEFDPQNPDARRRYQYNDITYWTGPVPLGNMELTPGAALGKADGYVGGCDFPVDNLNTLRFFDLATETLKETKAAFGDPIRFVAPHPLRNDQTLWWFSSKHLFGADGDLGKKSEVDLSSGCDKIIDMVDMGDSFIFCGMRYAQQPQDNQVVFGVVAQDIGFSVTRQVKARRPTMIRVNERECVAIVDVGDKMLYVPQMLRLGADGKVGDPVSIFDEQNYVYLRLLPTPGLGGGILAGLGGLKETSSAGLKAGLQIRRLTRSGEWGDGFTLEKFRTIITTAASDQKSVYLAFRQMVPNPVRGGPIWEQDPLLYICQWDDAGRTIPAPRVRRQINGALTLRIPGRALPMARTPVHGTMGGDLAHYPDFLEVSQGGNEFWLEHLKSLPFEIVEIQTISSAHSIKYAARPVSKYKYHVVLAPESLHLLAKEDVLRVLTNQPRGKEHYLPIR